MTIKSILKKIGLIVSLVVVPGSIPAYAAYLYVNRKKSNKP